MPGLDIRNAQKGSNAEHMLQPAKQCNAGREGTVALPHDSGSLQSWKHGGSETRRGCESLLVFAAACGSLSRRCGVLHAS